MTPSEIQTVQNLIEKCLQLYMTKQEVLTALKLQAQIDPEFTEFGDLRFIID